MPNRQLMKVLLRENNPTPLRKIIPLCGRCKCDHVYVKDEYSKDEGKYRSGTFKDRRNAALLWTYRNRPELIFVHITNGNSGYSLGQGSVAFEEMTGKKRMVVNVVDRKTPKKIKERLRECSTVVEMNLGKEPINDDELRKKAREATGYEGPEDNIVHVESLGLNHGYGEIVQEIKAQLEELGKKPDYIFCPVGGGELAREVAAEAEAIWREDAPKIIGVTVPQNVLVSGKKFIRKVKYSVADKISCGYSKFREAVQNFVAKGRIELKTVKEGEIVREYRYLNEIGVNSEPSAAVAFVGAAKYDLKPSDVVVVINSGKGIYDKRRVERTWLRRIKKAAVYAAFVIMAGVIAIGGAYSYALHRMDYRSKIQGEAFVHAQEEAKRRNIEDMDYAELVCHFLMRSKDYGYKIEQKKVEKACKEILPFHIGDAHLEFYNSYSRLSEGTVDRIVGSVMRDMVERYNEGYYDDTPAGKWRRFKKWFEDTFSESKRREVFEFYLPQYRCWRTYGDYDQCMRFYRIWKPPEVNKKGEAR